MNNLPDHVFGVRAVGEVTETELKEVLLPGLEVIVEKYSEISYLLVMETEVENYQYVNLCCAGRISRV